MKYPNFNVKNEDGEVINMLGKNLHILADDGRELLSLRMNMDGTIEVAAAFMCKHGEKVLDTQLIVNPESHSRITLSRPEYK